MDSFVSVAKIVKIRGVRGEVAAEILTDFPERFTALGGVRLYNSEYVYWENLESSWFHKGRVILKFKGRESPEEVRELVGFEVQVPEDERVDLPEDTYFDSELIGCRVIQEGVALGKVVNLLKAGDSSTNLVVVSNEDKEFMVPFVSEFIRDVELERREITVKLPPGLVELAIERKPKQRKK